MKLGIIGSPNKESFKYAKQKGLDFLEFTLNIGYDLDNQFFNKLDEIKDYINKYNVLVGSIGRWGTDKISSKGEIIKEELEISKKLIDACEFLNCPVFVCGVNYVKEISFYQNCSLAIEFLTELVNYAKQKNVKVATYNCRWNNFIYSEETWKIIHGHIDDLGIKYDPSHSIYDNGDYLKEARDWGKRFYHVHIKGSLMIDRQRFDDPPAGLDITNWGAFLSILYAYNYKGGLSIEPHSQNWHGELGEKGVDFTIRFFKNLIL
ncbi:sugar phosphate isomerase/epimerase family protein [Caldicellulosiruptoraceae bacterium PP1]